MRQSQLTNWEPDRTGIEPLLERAEIEDCTLLPSGSNYVFVLHLSDTEHGQGLAIYKPQRGEAPLWDFPGGTLYRRERAAYVLSRGLGWSIVPPTVIRDGPYGPGMVQLFIPHDPRVTFFTLRDAREFDMRRIAVFDAVINNADRKGGHCLCGPDGRIWAIDHGLTFHESNKLRTVIWDYSGEAIPEELLADLQGLSVRLRHNEELKRDLSSLIDQRELQALQQRVERLILKPVFPRPGLARSVPWPPV